MQIFAGQVRFGIHAGPQNTTYDDYLALWRKAEELGYDWASVFDHFLPIQADPSGPCLEGLSLLSALAAQTSRIRCGILVVGNTYRHPAVVANMAATIDHVSRGRLELGMGAAWFELEHRQYGIPFPSTGRRIRMLGEAVKIIKSLWTQERTTFQGRYYTLTDAFCQPKPVQQPHIPLWVGGQGERFTLRVVAESADGWNTFLMPLEAYRHKLAVLAEHCREVGRDPEDIRKSLVFSAILRPSEAEARERAQRLASAMGTTLEALQGRFIIGTPEQCIERLLPYVHLGVGDFLLGARAPADLPTLELVAREVAPAVKAEGSRILASRG
jgi:F420-dependent oxidoreductase-like protein